MDGYAGRHLRISNQRIRNRKTLEEKPKSLLNEAPLSTTLRDLPLEILDMILQRSYLHWILNSSTMKKDQEVIRSLMSVEFCFRQRITRQRFKRVIWHYLRDFYGRARKRYAIIRNNRSYLLENILSNDELINSLLFLNCITEKQRHLIQRQRSDRKRNSEFLYVLKHFNETELSNVVNCLRQTNQKMIARIIENGGGVIKVEVQTRGTQCIMSMDIQPFHKKVEDLRNRTKPVSQQIDSLMSQLKDEGLEILSSQMDRRTVGVWILCHSQKALENCRGLYESNKLRDLFFQNIQPSISMVINIDMNQFKKTIVICPISVNFTRRIYVGFVNGVTKLRNEIYVICHLNPTAILVFEDQNPFRHQRNIDLEEIRIATDIGSNEMQNCLYASDYQAKCLWKIAREADGQYKNIKWLTTDYRPSSLSVSNDGQLLVVSHLSSILSIYGSDAELVRLIRLRGDINHIVHAVESSFGNYIILFGWNKNLTSLCKYRSDLMEWGIRELTRDGKMVIRSFIPSNETQKLDYPRYLSLDSDDRVFVSDYFNRRVILLDSDLRWNRILYPEKEETPIGWPQYLCYDEEKKQLIIGEYLEDDRVNVFTLRRN